MDGTLGMDLCLGVDIVEHVYPQAKFVFFLSDIFTNMINFEQGYRPWSLNSSEAASTVRVGDLHSISWC